MTSSVWRVDDVILYLTYAQIENPNLSVFAPIRLQLDKVDQIETRIT